MALTRTEAIVAQAAREDKDIMEVGGDGGSIGVSEVDLLSHRLRRGSRRQWHSCRVKAWEEPGAQQQGIP